MCVRDSCRQEAGAVGGGWVNKERKAGPRVDKDGPIHPQLRGEREAGAWSGIWNARDAVSLVWEDVLPHRGIVPAEGWP